MNTHSQLDGEAQTYGPPELDALLKVMRDHTTTCAPCRLEWVRLLFRFKLAAESDQRPRRVKYKAPSELEALTGATTDEALWEWLGRQ
ncbi:MAG TPA: hypothetical protein VK427_03750 [Kofleriaceae bacterium]|nr:hypothetical protein [Kofleriaceae bacterium]